MKISKIILPFTFGATCLTGIRCGSYSKPKYEHFSSVKFQVKEKSKQFSNYISNIQVDTTENKLRVKFNFDFSSSFPFPIIDSTKDTLFSTAFEFEFFSNGYPITLEHAVVFPSVNERYTGYYRWGKEIDSTLVVKCDTASLRKMFSVQAVIPFYAFQNMKSGKQNIEVRISQSRFCSEQEQYVKRWNETFHDSANYYYKNYIDRSLISGIVSFSLIVPSIYKTILYGEGLQLKSDSTFSPHSMDFALFGTGLPDIYYRINSPKEMYYSKTPVEYNSDHYSGTDTFSLYHYHPNDSIGIDVYDADDLSPDDWMGTWEGSLDKLRGDYTHEINFDYIKWFCIKEKSIGVINK